MPTLTKLIDDGQLVRIEIELEGALPWRTLLGTPDFVRWLDEELPKLETTIVGGDLTPEEQVYAIFYDYVTGAHIQFHTDDRRFKKLNPLNHNVWELKTLDLRVFGWVLAKDCFICTYGKMKDELELMNSYGRYVALTVGWRNKCGLDKPNVVTGENYNDVLSDAH